MQTARANDLAAALCCIALWRMRLGLRRLEACLRVQATVLVSRGLDSASIVSIMLSLECVDKWKRAQAKVCNPNLPEEATMLDLLCTICTICIVATDQDKFGAIYKL